MPAKPRKLRLDELLVERQLCDSRSRAKALIMSGKIRSGTTILDKPGKTFPEDIEIELEQPPRFVSRGGEKLEAFLEAFQVDVKGQHSLDVGASTGGFTDCLLQRGVIAATCVDVGRAQLSGKLLSDPRVRNFEKVNARDLESADLPQATYPIVVMDLSFISLRKVLPAIWPRVETGGVMVSLIKPQFEASKVEVDKGRGIIRDSTIQERTKHEILEFALQNLAGSSLIGSIDSPIKGGDGNREFLAGWTKV
ncbi:MAG: TlyA family RNA methyltransferase [Verrucomicrobiota bacterium]